MLWSDEKFRFSFPLPPLPIQIQHHLDYDYDPQYTSQRLEAACWGC